MKRFLIFNIIFISCISGKSQGLSPSSMTCLQPFVYMHPDFIGSYSIKREFSSNSCIVFNETTETGNLIREGKTNVIAGQSIHILDNMHIGFAGAPPVYVAPGESTEAEFHAYIGTNDFDVFWFEPNSTVGTVGKYEKLELGLRIPTTLVTSINNFVTNASTTDKINPFNPEEISVEAQFYFLDNVYSTIGGTVDKKVFGFYYKEFFTPTLTDLNWDDSDTAISFPFRIRFAPDKLGNWAVKIKIVTPSGTLEALPVNFTCVPSDNPGFISISENNTYLKLGENTFFPVGTNLPYPTVDALGNEPYLYSQVPPKGYIQYHQEMQNLRLNGANYFRMLVAPWATDIEFEHIGNYSDRMDNAWEMDRILNKAKDLDLYLTFNFQFHYALENPTRYGMYNWDWVSDNINKMDPGHTVFACDPITYSYVYDNSTNIDKGNCYQYELGLTDPIEFFTNSMAIKHYKNKLRYMLSRWGYSTNIGIMELWSEIDNSGNQHNWEIKTTATDTVNFPCGLKFDVTATTARPYWENPSVIDHIESWQIDIAKYIKDGLGYSEHLIGADYTGGPPDEISNPGTGVYSHVNFYGPSEIHDQTYASNYIDIMSWNNYKGIGISRFEDLEFQRDIRFNLYTKPILLSEIGAGGRGLDPLTGIERDYFTLECDNNTEFVRSIWATTFSGTAGIGLEYNGLSHDNFDNWHYYGILNDFMDGVDLANGIWEVQYDTKAGEIKDSEVYALVNELENKAIGVVMNRRYNYFTQTTFGSICTTADPGLPYKNIANVEPEALQPLKLKHLTAGSYNVKWYNALTGSLVRIDTQIIPPLGNWHIDFPPLCMFSCVDEPSPLLSFKLEKISSKMMAVTDPIKDTAAESINFVDPSIAISPNPSNGLVNVLLKDFEIKNMHVKVLDTKGTCVFRSMPTELLFQINLTNLSNGVYFIEVQNINQILTYKLILVNEE